MKRLSLIFACALENKAGSRGQNSSNKNICSFKVLCPDSCPVLILELLFSQAGLLSQCRAQIQVLHCGIILMEVQ